MTRWEDAGESSPTQYVILKSLADATKNRRSETFVAGPSGDTF
jgi:hypothetical protein